MKRQRFLTVTVGIMVLSVGLVLMTNSAQAAPPSLPNTSSWDKNLPSDTRFTTVFTGAVRDNNTGLVWEQAPDPTPTTGATRSSLVLTRLPEVRKAGACPRSSS